MGRLQSVADRSEVLTFLCVLEPFNKLFHLLKENAFSFSLVGFIVPLQNRLLAQDIGWEKKNKKTHKDKNENRKQKKKSFQLDANSTDASAGAGKTNVTRQVDDINQGKVLAIISGHLASVKVNVFTGGNSSLMGIINSPL